MDVCTVQATTSSNALVFRCSHPDCRRRTFGRWGEFNRHYNGSHASDKTVFWCPVAGCSRSEAKGTSNRPFPRKDRMMDHVMKIHGSLGVDQNEADKAGEVEI